MSCFTARTIVFTTSAAVLVLEILAGRLMAPYLGVTLETFTGIIGVVLAGISVGAWLGGRIADVRPPRPILGPLLIAGGVLSLLAPTIVHGLGPSMRAGGPLEIVALTLASVCAPSVVLSAVPPMVVKLRLQSLEETGSVVGTLSAIGTAGAIFGTFATGFVLVATVPTDAAVMGLGATLVSGGAILLVRRTPGILSVALIPALVAAALLPVVDGPCDEETAYYCAFVTVDDARPTGRILWLDDLRHSYVDLEDPEYLGFRYARVMADVLATIAAGPLDVLAIGGGGFTLPRYLGAVRPGSATTVLEIDPSLPPIAEHSLALDPESVEVVIGDARVSMERLAPGSFDVVIGDAFGSLSVPWHLTTREFVTSIRDRLRPGGIYLLNLIDYPPLGFARAEAATIAEVFASVVVVAPPGYLDGSNGGNLVIVASDAPIDVTGIETAISRRGGLEIVATGSDFDGFVSGSTPLRDDFAPVDQLLGRP